MEHKLLGGAGWLVGWLAGYSGEAAMRILPINAWMIFVLNFSQYWHFAMIYQLLKTGSLISEM